MQQLYKIVPPNTDIRTAFKKGSEDEKNFIQNLAIFFGTFFASHRKDLEQDRLLKMVIDGHFYLVQLSTVDDIEVFRICLDYWHQLTSDLYHEAPVNSPLMLDSFSASTPRRQLYKDVLSKVRDVVISRMAKPEEVIVVEVFFFFVLYGWHEQDENGNIVKEVRKDGEQVTRYKLMRSVLVYLTHLDYEDTQNIMMEKLTSQVDTHQFSWNKLNTLCWAIGSIADTQRMSFYLNNKLTSTSGKSWKNLLS